MPESEELTRLIMEVFLLNAQFIATGDRLTKDFGLTGARWQVLGAIRMEPLPVAQIARNMGLTRQSVQRIANILVRDGFVRFRENPNHKRAKLVELTDHGRTILEQVSSNEILFSNRIAKGFSPSKLDDVNKLLRSIRRRLESALNMRGD